MLFANCQLVRGYKKSILVDLAQHKYIEIENDIFDVLKKNKESNCTKGQLKKIYSHKLDDGIDAFFDYFQVNGYGFFTKEPELYPSLSLEWYSPFAITNAILEVDSSSNYNLENTIRQLENLGCAAIEIRFKDTYSVQESINLLTPFSDSRIKAFYLFLRYSENLSIAEVTALRLSISRLVSLIIHSVEKTKLDSLNHLFSVIEKVKFTNMNFYDNSCEDKSIGDFAINIESFSEANHYSLGLNRKVCVDAAGNIKNYISHQKIFGNIKTDTIRDVIARKDFQSIWNINNDSIEVCKDCQFRYLCLDNSDLLSKNNKIFKLETCNFNPYKNKWKK